MEEFDLTIIGGGVGGLVAASGDVTGMFPFTPLEKGTDSCRWYKSFLKCQIKWWNG